MFPYVDQVAGVAFAVLVQKQGLSFRFLPRISSGMIGLVTICR